MTIKEQFVKTLFNKNTLEKVKEQFKNGTEIIPVDEFDMNFRLLLSKDIINLELLTVSEFGYYFKPIGFYDQNNNVFILKEFETDVKNLIENKEISTDKNILKLSIEQNAVIGAFSIEAYIKAKKSMDDSFTSNGLDFDIFMSFNGDPQVFLEDKYNVSGAIAIYFLKGERKTINPTVQYKQLFDDFSQRKLLTAFKTI